MHGPTCNRRPSQVRMLGRTIRLLIWALMMVAVLPLEVSFAKDDVWRQDTAAAFGRGKREGVVVTDGGLVRLSRGLSSVGTLDVSRVWDLARGGDGSLFAATGDQGQVYRRVGDEAWKLVHDSDDSQVFTLAVSRDGQVFAGTGPGGQVIDLGMDGTGRNASRPSPDVKYIWDLAFASDGTLYAATGPGGQLWKRSRAKESPWILVLDSPRPHLLCVAAAPDGSVYAGSDGGGLVYRVAADGKISVVLVAPQEEIRALCVGPDGALYAGTASSAVAATPPGRTSFLLREPSFESIFARSTVDDRMPRLASTSLRLVSFSNAQDKPTAPDLGGTARLRGGPPGENVVYQIDREDSVREIFRGRAVVFALAWQGDRLLVGTGPEGQLFELGAQGRETSALARLDHGQILSLLPDLDQAQGLLIAAGDPGGVYRLDSHYLSSGSLTSEVYDTKLVSRFGALNWRADTPGHSSVSLRLRTGNVTEPDETWSSWSQPIVVSGTTEQVPQGRFVQYRAELSRGDDKLSPQLKSVALAYRTRNQPPELGAITIPDLSTADGTTRKTRLDLKWEASDPNDDELEFTLLVRKEDWPDWLSISGDSPLTDKQLAWDTTAFPAGLYRLKVVASDRRSNPGPQALERSKETDPFLVDHLPPTVEIEVKGMNSSASVRLRDDWTRLVKAEYALDGGPWAPAFADDGIFDTLRESSTIRFADLKPGTHVLVVRATDAAGNVGAADVVFRVP